MTYRDLLAVLSKMDNESLEMDLTISFQDEFYPADLKFADDDQSIIDLGHPFFSVRESPDN